MRVVLRVDAQCAGAVKGTRDWIVYEDVAERLRWCGVETRIVETDVESDAPWRKWLAEHPLWHVFFADDVQAEGAVEFATQLDTNLPILEEVCVRVGQRMAASCQGMLLGVLIKPARMKDFAERQFFGMVSSTVELRNRDVGGECEEASQQEGKDLAIVTEDVEFRSAPSVVIPVTLEIATAPELLSQLDGILFKASDFLNERTAPGELFAAEFLELQEQLMWHPEICVIDRLECIENVCCLRQIEISSAGASLDHDFRFHLSLSEAVHSQDVHPVAVLSRRTVTSWCNALQYLRARVLSGLTYPVVVKPASACGTTAAHFVAMVWNEHGFRTLQVEYPLCIQQFHSHNQILWKAYIVGHRVFIEKERSLIDAMSKPASGILHFEALKLKSPGAPFEHVPQSGTGLDREIILATARSVRQRSGLKIFGLDVVVDAVSGAHVLVDVNHFPSMKRIPRSIEALWEVMTETVQQFRSHSTEKSKL